MILEDKHIDFIETVVIPEFIKFTKRNYKDRWIQLKVKARNLIRETNQYGVTLPQCVLDHVATDYIKGLVWGELEFIRREQGYDGYCNFYVLLDKVFAFVFGDIKWILNDEKKCYNSDARMALAFLDKLKEKIEYGKL